MNFRPRQALISAAIVALTGCSNRIDDTPVFALDRCFSISLIDAESGSEVVGAEDLDIDRANGRIFASAYDRRVSEKAAKNKAPSIPGGGIYAIDLSALLDARGSLKISSMISAGALEEGLRPHGISFDKNTGALDFINRGYSRDGSNWRMTPQILRIDLEGAITSVADDPECSANDVAAAQGRLFITLDHGSCGWRASLEDIFGGKHGRLVDAHRTTLLSGIGFANGVIVTDDGRLFVAATRDKAVLAVTVDENGATAGQKASALGAPDNLTLSDRGNVVAAVHPSLLSLGMQRRLGIGRSPSRVVEFDFDRGKLHVLFDDPKASLISAASAAVLSADALIIGSVLDRGLVVCRKDPAAL